MSANFSSAREDPAATEPSEGPGRRLRLARQAQGLDLDRVADALHLSTTLIESLEREDYQALPGRVFVVGYIRKYARLVGLAPEPLLAAYQAGVPQSEPTRAGTAPRPNRQNSSGHLVIRLLSFGLVILLAALAFRWWEAQRPGADVESANPGAELEVETTTTPEPAAESRAPTRIGATPSAQPAADEPSMSKSAIQPAMPGPPLTHPREQESTILSTAESGEDMGERTNSASGTDTDSASVPAEKHTEEPAAAREELEKAAAATAEIVMSFDGTCWVDVRDSERKYKLFGEMKKGDRHVLEGKPPYSVILGNAAAVKITIGGQPFDLSAKSRGNVARFTLDPGQGQEKMSTGRQIPSVGLDPVP